MDCIASLFHKELSSSGLTGRSSTPRPLDLFSGASGILDHPLFAGDDDIVRPHRSAFPRRDAPELCMNHSPKKTEGVGNAGCPMHPQPRMQSRKHTSVVTTGPPEKPGIPARNGFNGFLRALPGDRAFLSPSSADMVSANLTPASRRQDHTTSPSASARFVKRAAR